VPTRWKPILVLKSDATKCFQGVNVNKSAPQKMQIFKSSFAIRFKESTRLQSIRLPCEKCRSPLVSPFTSRSPFSSIDQGFFLTSLTIPERLDHFHIGQRSVLKSSSSGEFKMVECSGSVFRKMW
jgi:hypothetical protein